MPTQTRTFPATLNSISTTAVTEIVHFRDVPLLADESVAVYLDAMFLNVSLKSFQLMKFPNYEGDESDAERLSLFTAAELQSQKIGLRILSRKNNTNAWREKAEIILTNAGRKSYFDLLIPYLAKAQVRLLEYNDALGVQLIDYGNGLLKLTDYIEIECAISVEIAKKNDNFTELSARIASLELALQGKLINLPANSLLGKGATAGTVEVIPSSTFATPAQITAAINTLTGNSSTALDTLAELGVALANDANFATTITNALATKAPLVNPVFTGYVTLGDNISIKLKRLIGITSTNQGGTVSLLHKLNGEKIIGMIVKLSQSLGGGIDSAFDTFGPGYSFDYWHDADNIHVQLSPNNSTYIVNKPFSVLVFYIA